MIFRFIVSQLKGVLSDALVRTVQVEVGKPVLHKNNFDFIDVLAYMSFSSSNLLTFFPTPSMNTDRSP